MALPLHKDQHQRGGTDSIKLDDLAFPDDNTDLNATSSRHGLLAKLSGVSTEVLLGSGSFGAVPTATSSASGGVNITSTRTETFLPLIDGLLSGRGRTLLKCTQVSQGVTTELGHAFTHSGAASDGGVAAWGSGTTRTAVGSGAQAGSATTSFITSDGGLLYRPYMIGKFRTGSDISSMRIWCTMWDASTALNADDPAGSTIFGLRYSDGTPNNNWQLARRKAADGAITLTDTGVEAAADTGYLVQLYYTGTNLVTVINGTSTSVAIGSMSATEVMPGFALLSTNTAAVTRTLTVNTLYLSHD